MKRFSDVYPSQRKCQLTMVDRILFNGYLSGLYPANRFGMILYHQEGVRLKEYKEYAEASTKQLKRHLEQTALAANRPIVYLRSGYGPRRESKEELARSIVEEENIEQGLIAIFSALDLNQIFSVRGERQRDCI